MRETKRETKTREGEGPPLLVSLPPPKFYPLSMKVLDLFGNEIETIAPSARKREKGLFDDYEGFVEKFKPKKTTDDCYTPAEVYNEVLAWVREQCDLEGCRIVRPFYPGGDYEMEDYQPGDVVVDNPPFSIITKIVQWYQKRGIRFFLFGPHLTIFEPGRYCTTVLTNAQITYANGAVVNTSFVSNMFGDWGIIGAGDLTERLARAQRTERKQKRDEAPVYDYPANVISSARLGKFLKGGITFRIRKNEMQWHRALDAQRQHKKGIFGGGYLVSDRVAEEMKRVAEEEKRVAEEEKKARTVVFPLSEREREIVERLNGKVLED